MTKKTRGKTASGVAITDDLVAELSEKADAGYDVEEVRAWFSADADYTFLSTTLDKSSGVWQKIVPIADPAATTWFVDVQYKTKDLVAPTRFSLSTPPALPAGLVPKIRDINSCL